MNDLAGALNHLGIGGGHVRILLQQNEAPFEMTGREDGHWI